MRFHRAAPRILAAVALLAGALLTGCTGHGGTGGQFSFKTGTALGTTYPATDRKPAGGFTANLLNGGTVSLSQDAGKVVVINFWATWCAPCTVETPQFDQVYRAYKARGVTFLGVDTKHAPRSDAESFVRDNDIGYPIVYDEAGKAAIELGHIPAVSLPFTVLVDKHGRVAAVYETALTSKDLEPVLDSLTAES